MLIDADTHISPGGGAFALEEHLKSVERAGVDRTLCWLNPAHYSDYVGLTACNRYVYEAARRHPEAILGFGWADPTLGVQEARDTVRRCVEEYGFFGVKLNGAQNNYYIDDPEISLPVIEEIAGTGRLLAFHVGADAFEQTHPFRVAKIARRFPELGILMAHMGGVGHRDLTDAAIEFAAECPNLTLIGSAVHTRAILKAVRTLGAGRVCFGSDSPFELMHVELARYRAMLDGEVPEEDKARILGGNIARVLGLTD